MHMKLKQTLAGVATLAAAAGVLPLIAASPASAATNNGALTISPSSGTSAGNFTLNFGSGAPIACPGDSATGGYRVQGFVVPAATNLDNLAFNSVGPVGGGLPLIDTAGNTFVNGLTDITTGAISQLPGAYTFQFNAPGEYAAGAYNVGIACTLGTGAGMTKSYWTLPMTITTNTTTGGPAQINWSFGSVPSAPSITSVTTGAAGATSAPVTVSFGAVTATPAVSGYAATLTPTGGGSPLTVTGAGSPITVPNVPFGSYNVSVTATNSSGTGAAGNYASNPYQVAPGAQPAPGLALGTTTSSSANFNITAPTGETATRTGYTLTVTPQPSGTPIVQTLAASATTASVTGLAMGNYTATLQATYPAPFVGAPSAPLSFTLFGDSILVQDITVTRPVGALVLTQVCGAYGALASETAQLGFPAGLPAATAVNSSTVAAPTTGGTAPTTGPTGAGPADPVRNQYPYPTNPDGTPNVTYPTHCGISLGNAQFVRSGAGAGQFFAADGRLNQVTVVDTRDADTGWNAVGQVSNFTSGPSASFSGSQLGWVPVKTEDTSAFTDSLGNTYDQVTTAGGPIAPNTLVASGLSSNRTLLQAAGLAGTGQNHTGGLGTAIADARLKLLIPITAQSGVYTATLTISTL
jgi:hypothetical protein